MDMKHFSLVVATLVLAPAVHAQKICINEIQSANIDQFVDPSFNFGGWIELYNPGDEEFPLEGCLVKDSRGNSYELTELNTPVPAHGYSALYF